MVMQPDRSEVELEAGAMSAPGEQPAIRDVPASALSSFGDGQDDWEPDPRDVHAVGRTMFDVPGAEDNALTVLLPRDKLGAVPAQALLRIESREDGRTYLA